MASFFQKVRDLVEQRKRATGGKYYLKDLLAEVDMTTNGFLQAEEINDFKISKILAFADALGVDYRVLIEGWVPSGASKPIEVGYEPSSSGSGGGHALVASLQMQVRELDNERAELLETVQLLAVAKRVPIPVRKREAVKKGRGQARPAARQGYLFSAGPGPLVNC